MRLQNINKTTGKSYHLLEKKVGSDQTCHAMRWVIPWGAAVEGNSWHPFLRQKIVKRGRGTPDA